MRAAEFCDKVTAGGGENLDGVLALLKEKGVRFCVIGGQAVNYYAEPLASLDVDFVVAMDRLDEVEALLRERFHVRRFPHCVNQPHKGPIYVFGSKRTPATRTSSSALFRARSLGPSCLLPP